MNTVSEKDNINIEIAKYFNLQRSYDSVAYYLDAAESNPKQLTIEQKATIYNLKMMVSYYSGAIDSAINKVILLQSNTECSATQSYKPT
ncbi:MAG: hypothetical protein NWR30_01640 [Salibacteraceae bacterium]|nr:hypothetical protein [Salibacteraceae bacterium]